MIITDEMRATNAELQDLTRQWNNAVRKCAALGLRVEERWLFETDSRSGVKVTIPIIVVEVAAKEIL